MAGNTVYVQGSYVDVHDNEVVNLSIDEAGEVHVGEGQQAAHDKVFNKELLARAIENSHVYFWGNSAYAVVFCVCRDDLNMEPNKASFETMVEGLPYSKPRSFTCPENTIATAFNNNPIYNDNINNWDGKNPMARIIKLRDELRRQIKFKE